MKRMGKLCATLSELPTWMQTGRRVRPGDRFVWRRCVKWELAACSRRDISVRGHAIVVDTNIADFTPINGVLLRLYIFVDNTERHFTIALIRLPIHADGFARRNIHPTPGAPLPVFATTHPGS